ncbi:(2Fe-2S)-binding protein [Streptomyces sp. WAC06614]|uniref:(2Fe-2S)-binding protein n=1 Tax=Streptomyces sp. WAC06614 TaxID=2487416 RepID=UPI0021AFBE6B|nr:(2Fe-2S)-binding protein [Streptomyces sp. WAC06614]
MREVLRELARVGPFFDVPVGDRPPGDGFRPLGELYGEGLGGYVAEVGRRLGSADPRVAASTAQLGIASRMWSLGLGCAVLSGQVPDLAPDRVRWRLPPAGSLQLWLPEPVALPGGELARTVLDGNLAVLDRAVRDRFGLSPRILRGNAASALVGALRVLMGRLPGPPYPPVPVVAGLLADDGPLAGTGTFVHEEGLGVAFVRRSCCLYYRVPTGGGLCGDCVLRTR